MLRSTPVHPRACGERWDLVSLPWYPVGSSPRVRGTEPPTSLWALAVRFIPARAGNGPVTSNSRRPKPVHPRACGERLMEPEGAHQLYGSSPRVRGTAASAQVGDLHLRFIPARAGNGYQTSDRCPPAPVHPRACGERPLRSSLARFWYGSSPRVRGTEGQPLTGIQDNRFIPARAGNGISG